MGSFPVVFFLQRNTQIAKQNILLSVMLNAEVEVWTGLEI